MTADERIALIRIKIERAKKHIIDLQAAIHAFGESHPYEIGTKRYPQTRKIMYYLADFRDVPLDISAIAGDVLQNLRSALDHLTCQLVCAAGNKPTLRTSFPIFDSATKYKAKSPGKVEGMRQDAIHALNGIKPYKGGNNTLWLLHKLNNIDKHRLLVSVLIKNYATSFKLGDPSALELLIDFRRAFKDYPGADITKIGKPLKAGDVLFISAPDSELKQKVQFHFHVALNEPEIGESQPLIETLQHMVDLVDNIVACFRPLLA